MTIRYVGPGGSNAWDGLSWATRKLTLNGVEDTPVVAGDTVYVGPGTYREQFTIDVSGSAGLPITYIADVLGINTDGVGGIVRITGSNTDETWVMARDFCIYASVARDYRTFKGFYLEQGDCTGDSTPYGIVKFREGSDNLVFQDCVFGEITGAYAGGASGIVIHTNTTVPGLIVERCISMTTGRGLIRTSGSGDANTSEVRNCISVRNIWGLYLSGQTNWASRHITAFNSWFDQPAIIATGNVYDSLIANGDQAISGATSSYNSFSSIPTEGGSNDLQTYIVPVPPVLFAGIRFPHDPFLYTGWNEDIFAATTSSLTEDFYGISRPTKTTRGAVQFRGVNRDSDVSKTGLSSTRMDDASRHLILIPVQGGGTYRAEVWVRREDDYSGTAPQLVIDSPGASAVTDTDTGATGEWNKLLVSITVGDKDRFAQIELRSNNAATSGDYKVFFDDIGIKGLGAKIPTSKWITNEVLIHSFGLDVLDPWITPTVVVPTAGPVGYVAPVPTFFKA